MVDLCEFTFDKGFKGNGNPSISKICQVACPSQLVQATGIHRADEANGNYVCNGNLEKPGGFITSTMNCGNHISPRLSICPLLVVLLTTSYIYSTAKPSYAWQDNIRKPTVEGYSAVIPCRRDGYTRVNEWPATASPSEFPTIRPSNVPSEYPSFKPSKIVPSSSPTEQPSAAPTLDSSLCCLTTDYSQTDFHNCESGVISSGPIASCATCVAYQCIDWDIGSAANTAREAEYFAQTGDQVYFGVAAYSNRTTSAGLCYRVTSPSIDRDLIVQIVDAGYGTDTGNINLQMADGGFGPSDACTFESTSMPQFTGTAAVWGV